ncbi:MAG: hypothetical protein KAR19_14660 [Bacteroidales bacterium]|nr:hypothetical protein [Bacteroidales bacterium]
MKSLIGSFVLLAAFLGVSILHQGCATILAGRTNSMVFTSEAEVPAQVFIDDTLVGQAPGKIVFSKQVVQHGSNLEIRAEGYKTQEYLILRKPHPAFVLADFFTGIVPLIVDTSNGNILRPSPRKFDIKLEKED